MDSVPMVVVEDVMEAQLLSNTPASSSAHVEICGCTLGFSYKSVGVGYAVVSNIANPTGRQIQKQKQKTMLNLACTASLVLDEVMV